MDETTETFAIGDLVETRLGHRYRVIRMIAERNLVECTSEKYPEFDPYKFPVEALRRVEAEVMERVESQAASPEEVRLFVKNIAGLIEAEAISKQGG